jgi:RsiW-degrading membrane proteinase PrsW (M82 family)
MNWISYALIIIPLAIAPGIAISFFIYFRDKYEKEPFRLLLGCFLFGMLSTVPAALIEAAEGRAGFGNSDRTIIIFLFSFIGIGMIEELSKFFFVRVYAYPKKAFNEPFDGIVYSVMVAMGFATLENVQYAVLHGMGTTLFRMFTAVPLHATCGIIMGFFLGLAKFNNKPLRYIFTGILLAILVHGLYDFFLIQQDSSLLMIMAFVSLGGAVTLSFFAIRSSQKKSPFKKIPADEKDN